MVVAAGMMGLSGRGWRRALAQFRDVADRLVLGGLVALCVVLLVLAKADVQLAGFLAGRVGDVAAPVLGLANAPVLAARRGLDRLGELLAVFEENGRLREENRRLQAWQAEAARLSVQNDALRQMLDIPAAERAPARTTARVVGDSGGPFVHTRLIDAGAGRGVREGMAVVTPQGFAGRVIGVGRHSARILLVTDLNSKIPVMVERSRDRAILEGDNGPEPALRFLPVNPGLAVGDLVLTSGEGGLLPAGLSVGRVSAVGGQEVAKVRPFVDWGRLDHVAVLLDAGVRPPEADEAPAPAAPSAGAPAAVPAPAASVVAATPRPAAPGRGG